MQQILDFGAMRDKSLPERHRLGERIVVDTDGNEVDDFSDDEDTVDD